MYYLPCVVAFLMAKHCSRGTTVCIYEHNQYVFDCYVSLAVQDNTIVCNVLQRTKTCILLTFIPMHRPLWKVVLQIAHELFEFQVINAISYVVNNKCLESAGVKTFSKQRRFVLDALVTSYTQLD